MNHVKHFLYSVLLIVVLCAAASAATWTAVIDTVTKNPDGLTLTVAYHVTDGVNTINKIEPKVSNSDPTAIKRLAQDQADYQNKLVAQKQAQATLDQTKVVGPVDLTPPPPPPPTQQEIDAAKARSDFLAAWKTYQEIKLGLADGDEAKSLSAAKALYQPAFYGLIQRGF